MLWSLDKSAAIRLTWNSRSDVQSILPCAVRALLISPAHVRMLMPQAHWLKIFIEAQRDLTFTELQICCFQVIQADDQCSAHLNDTMWHSPCQMACSMYMCSKCKILKPGLEPAAKAYGLNAVHMLVGRKTCVLMPLHLRIMPAQIAPVGLSGPSAVSCRPFAPFPQIMQDGHHQNRLIPLSGEQAPLQ